jgi:hypothetical protein
MQIFNEIRGKSASSLFNLTVKAGIIYKKRWDKARNYPSNPLYVTEFLVIIIEPTRIIYAILKNTTGQGAGLT